MSLEVVRPEGEVSPEASELQPPPTDLELFSYGPIEGRIVRRYYGEGERFLHDFQYAQSKWDDLNAKVRNERAVMDGVRKELRPMAYEYISYRTTSTTYLAISTELSARGVSREDINQFFLRLFLANSVPTDGYTPQTVDAQKLNLQSSNKQRKFEITQERSRLAGNPPEWFSGSTNDWEKFFLARSGFNNLIKQELHDSSLGGLDKLGATFSSTMPDWLANMQDEEPTPEIVQKELDEDNQEWDSWLASYKELLKKDSDLYVFIYEKYKRKVLYAEQRRRGFFPQRASLADFLVYLHVTEEMPEYKGDLSFIENAPTHKILDKVMVKADNSGVNAIRQFSEFESPAPEIIALWLERKFKGAGIQASGQIDGVLQTELGLLRSGQEDELKKLRDVDKNAFKLLNYEVKPLLSLLTDAEKAYFDELLQVSSGETVEYIIWELASVIGLKLGETKDAAAMKVKRELGRFTISWLTNNWRWAYQQLGDGIEGKREVRGSADAWDELEGGEEIGVHRKWDESKDEVLEDWDSIETDRLEDWNFQYAPDRRSDGKLIPIEGDTIEEMGNVLEGVLYRENQQVSIKKSSVVNALIWLTAMPPINVYTLPRMDVNGEEYLKVKRGPARILFQIDRDNHNIVFFLHQKKAMAYRF